MPTPSVKEIVEFERTRQLVTCEIHLFQEGSFWSAYEYSAWLSTVHLHELKVTHRSFRDIDNTVVFVGFPQTSLDKWLPEVHEEQLIDEKHLLVSLPGVSMPDNADDEFIPWKSSFHVAESQPRTTQSDKQQTAVVASSKTMTGIMRRILEYPLESKSPIDNMLFISSLKKEIVQFL